MTQPLIGLTLDSDEGSLNSKGGVSKTARYQLRANYAEAIAEAGGMPVGLPHAEGAAEAYADRLDALVVTGGAFDVDPALFGAESKHATVSLKPGRTGFELAVTQAMLKRKKPVLGICGGEQLLNVILGGTLVQHIEDEIEDSLLHEQPNPRNQPGHAVAVTPGSLLHRVTGTTEIKVNSAHHQAVKSVGPGVVVNAVAKDGVIEGIEDPRLPFCLGVQWHPEYRITEGDRKLFQALVAAAEKR
ncbi:MAG TPA: gamma-glutamyl-gamma-aminobutyrate hydrolase family protein [Candidatus Cybelea sp.]|nr:gamma-glutamyl-gamma-aminobutyrate hydrolase family protein [Candidatus Cybelea sp.]